MPRATSVIASSHGHGPVADTVILNYAQRSAAQGTVVSVKGATIDIDLHGPIRLRTDNLLQLDNGGLVEVVAASEPLIEVRAADVAVLARLAWHLGDRHIQVELLPNRIRVKREAAIEALLMSLGAKVTMIEAPFEPEGGAYAPASAQSQAHHHDHHHGHDYSHDHGHAHDHQHDEHCGHDHGHGHRHK